MQHFSMHLDLSDFFNDARSCSLVLIDTSWENVKDLQDHIQKLFQLSDISLLTKDGYYLPPKESIKVIKYTDSLKAFHLKVSPCPEEKTNKKKRKRSVESEEVGLASSPPNNQKRSNKAAETKNKRGRPLEDQSQIRESLQNNAAVEEESGFKELSVNKTDDTYHKNAKRTTHKGSISNNHIHFQEEGPVSAEVTTTENNSQSAKVLSIVLFRCPLLQLDSDHTRVFKLPRKPDPVKILENIVIPAPDTKKIEDQPQSAAISSKDEQPSSVAIFSNEEGAQIATLEDGKENIPQVPPSSRPSSPDSDDDVMVLDDTSVDSDSDVETVPLKTDGFSEVIADMLRNAAPLKESPNVGDTVIFKLPKSKGATSPFRTTEYLAGTCSDINRRTKSMTLSVIACADHNKSIILDQYSKKLNHPTVDPEIVLTVNLKEMIEPKVIVSIVD